MFSPNIQKPGAMNDSHMIYNWKRSQQTQIYLQKLRKSYQDNDHTYQDEIIM